MPETVYRSARIVIQNSTNALWTLDAAEVLTGRWAARSNPAADVAQVAPQSAAVLNSESIQLSHGTEGYVRFSSSDGQLHVHWKRPWVGDFDVQPHLSSPDLEFNRTLNQDNPANPVALIIVSPKSPK